MQDVPATKSSSHEPVFLPLDSGSARPWPVDGGVALRAAGWAGLTSIGFAATFGITTLSMVRAAPFNRSDLVLFAARGRTSPLAPLLVIVTILAWAGPLAGLMGKPVRRALHRG